MREDWKYRRGDIYFADLGVRIGSEQGGERPVIVIQNNVGNRHSPTLTVVPITSHLKKSTQPTHYMFSTQSVLKGTSMVMTEQIQTIDKQRVLSYAGKLTTDQLQGVMEAVKIHLGISETAQVSIKDRHLSKLLLRERRRMK